MTKDVRFFFDVGSPAAYLAWTQLPDICANAGACLIYKPTPNEIEAVVVLHEDVLECACVGEPDEKSGEVPHLYLVPKRPELRAQDIELHCRTNLAAYKVPKHYTFVDALPKSTVGKILRRELRTNVARSGAGA